MRLSLTRGQPWVCVDCGVVVVVGLDVDVDVEECDCVEWAT